MKINQDSYDQQTQWARSLKTLWKFFVAENEKTRKLIREENEETRQLLNELILTIKDTSEQSIASQLDISTMGVCKMERFKWYSEAF